jgi:hypothetical protein
MAIPGDEHQRRGDQQCTEGRLRPQRVALAIFGQQRPRQREPQGERRQGQFERHRRKGGQQVTEGQRPERAARRGDEVEPGQPVGGRSPADHLGVCGERTAEEHQDIPAELQRPRQAPVRPQEPDREQKRQPGSGRGRRTRRQRASTERRDQRHQISGQGQHPEKRRGAQILRDRGRGRAEQTRAERRKSEPGPDGTTLGRRGSGRGRCVRRGGRFHRPAQESVDARRPDGEKPVEENPLRRGAPERLDDERSGEEADQRARVRERVEPMTGPRRPRHERCGRRQQEIRQTDVE